LTAVTLAGLLLAVVVGLVVAVAGYWVVMAVLVRRGRRRRAERLSEHPDAYRSAAPDQDWHGREV
jgi:Flp pilus assembly protein TadB